MWRAAVDVVLAALLAPPCASCGAALEHPLDGPVCARCWSRISPLTPPVCEGCGDALPSWRAASCAAGLCARCRRLRPPIDRMRAVGAYDGELRAIIQALKYDGRRTIASRLGALMRDAGREVLDGADGVVPVPLHPRRQRQRGFNQAVLLARHLRLPVHDVLRRIVNTRPQVEVPAARRHGNVRAAFAVAPARLRGWRSAKRGPAFPARVLVLVDDVMTTGATLGACALVLKQAGVGEVRALTAARAVSGPPRAPVR